MLSNDTKKLQKLYESIVASPNADVNIILLDDYNLYLKYTALARVNDASDTFDRQIESYLENGPDITRYALEFVNSPEDQRYVIAYVHKKHYGGSNVSLRGSGTLGRFDYYSMMREFPDVYQKLVYVEFPISPSDKKLTQYIQGFGKELLKDFTSFPLELQLYFARGWVGNCIWNNTYVREFKPWWDTLKSVVRNTFINRKWDTDFEGFLDNVFTPQQKKQHLKMRKIHISTKINSVLDSVKNGSKDYVYEGDINLENLDLTRLPDLSKYTIKGTFTCSHNPLTSLQGAPHTVNSFDCRYTNITNLLHGPINTKRYSVEDCKYLISLQGSPREVEDFSCSYCYNLKTLEHGPKHVQGKYMCIVTGIKNLIGAPVMVHNPSKWVSNKFECGFCSDLESLEGAPEHIYGDFECGKTPKLKSLEYAPKQIDGKFKSDQFTDQNYRDFYRSEGLKSVMVDDTDDDEGSIMDL